jgi:hypothetical protein
MSEQEGKTVGVCMHIAVVMVAMCFGAFCHVLWQKMGLSHDHPDVGDGNIREQESSNSSARVSIPWGRAEFDYPDIDGCEQQQADEEFLESLLTACGFEYQPSYEMRECRCYIVDGLESWILIQCGIVRCKGWAGGVILEDRSQIAIETVERLNAVAPPNVRLCIDGDLLWCESALPIEVLRRMVSVDEQREALRLLSKVPNDAIKGYMPELNKFLSRGE